MLSFSINQQKTLFYSKASNTPIFCSLCRFCALNPNKILQHADLSHNSGPFVCGVEGCTAPARASIMSLRNHLRDKHSDFYYGIEKVSDFSRSSIFRSHKTSIDLNQANHEIDEADITDEPDIIDLNQANYEIEIDHEIDEADITVPSPLTPNNGTCNSNLDEISLNHNFDSAIENFVQILLEGGVKTGIPFTALKYISANIVKLFEGLHYQNHLTPEIFYEMKYCTSNSDNFDKCLIRYFGAIFPETINIAGTEENNFMYFPFRETLLNGIKHFSSFNEICGNESTKCIKSFFSIPQNRPDDIIYIEIYCDDFQLANPLLSKKSLNNSITGIYFRILTKNWKKNSKKKFSHLLALCYTSSFKENSQKIFKFIADQVNPLITNAFVVKIGNETRFTKLKIGFFCTDSKEANFLLGLKYGFNHNDCCRFCETPRSEFSSTFSESLNLKTQEWYTKNFGSLINLDIGNHVSGIQKISPVSFFQTDGFFDMFPPCIDHDIFEGIVPKIAKFALEYFRTNKLLSFVDFKKRVSKFKFQGKDKKNFPLISFENIEQIRFTASEGYTFIRFFPFFLSDLDLDDSVVKMITILNKIVLILMSNNINSEEDLTILDNLVELFLRQCSLLENLKMTVKFHHLTHYVSNILKFGPPKTFRTINFESIHSTLKHLIKSSQNWKDICYTIAMKYARLKVCDQDIQIQEIGMVEYAGNLPDTLSNVASQSIFSLKCLKIDNQVYTINSSAIYTLINDRHLFLLIEKIFKIDENYFLNGDVYDFYESEYSTFVLEPTKSKGLYLLGSSDDSDISYD